MSEPWRKPKGATRRISEDPTPCASPYHNPPMFMVYKPGRYEHTCPACGHRQTFTVPGIIA